MSLLLLLSAAEVGQQSKVGDDAGVGTDSAVLDVVRTTTDIGTGVQASTLDRPADGSDSGTGSESALVQHVLAVAVQDYAGSNTYLGTYPSYYGELWDTVDRVITRQLTSAIADSAPATDEIAGRFTFDSGVEGWTLVGTGALALDGATTAEGSAQSLRVTKNTTATVPGAQSPVLSVLMRTDRRVTMWLKGSIATTLAVSISTDTDFLFVAQPVTTSWVQYTFDLTSITGTVIQEIEVDYNSTSDVTNPIGTQFWIDQIVSGRAGVTTGLDLRRADTGTGTQSVTLAVAHVSAQTGTGTDGVLVDQTKTGADTGAGTESATLTTVVTKAESGTGTEARRISLASLLADVAGATETMTRQTNFSRAISDTAAATDAVSPLAHVSYSRAIADLGPFADTLARLLVATRGPPDSAPATDVVVGDVALGVVPKVGADTGTGTESVTLTLTRTVADTGAGIEVGTVAVTRTVTDTGAGSDSATLVAALTGTQTGTGTEALTALDRAVADTGTGTDVLVASDRFRADTGVGTHTATLAVARTVTETGTGVEAAFKAVTLGAPEADSAPAVDTLVRQLATPRTASDIAAATDALVRLFALPRPIADSAPVTDSLVITEFVSLQPTAVSVASGWQPINAATLVDGVSDHDETDWDRLQSFPQTMRLKLTSGSTPTTGARTLRMRVGNSGTGSITYTMTLLEGGGDVLGAGTLRGTLATTRAIPGYITVEVPVTDIIIDYADLYAEIKAEVP